MLLETQSAVGSLPVTITASTSFVVKSIEATKVVFETICKVHFQSIVVGFLVAGEVQSDTSTNPLSAYLGGRLLEVRIRCNLWVV